MHVADCLYLLYHHHHKQLDKITKPPLSCLCLLPRTERQIQMDIDLIQLLEGARRSQTGSIWSKHNGTTTSPLVHHMQHIPNSEHVRTRPFIHQICTIRKHTFTYLTVHVRSGSPTRMIAWLSYLRRRVHFDFLTVRVDYSHRQTYIPLLCSPCTALIIMHIAHPTDYKHP